MEMNVIHMSKETIPKVAFWSRIIMGGAATGKRGLDHGQTR
jgi:hypothetical protein